MLTSLLLNQFFICYSYTGASAVSVLGQTSGQMLPGLAAAAGFPMPAITVPAIDTIGVPSECLLLKNMFDPSLEVRWGNFIF